MNEKTILTLTAGRLLCGKIRNFLNACKFKGEDIEYLETTGWFEHDFIIKGDKNSLTAISLALDNWHKKIS